MKAVNLPAIGQVFYKDSTGFVLHELSKDIQLCKFDGVDKWINICHYNKELSVDEILSLCFNNIHTLMYNGKPCYEKELVVKHEIQFGEVFTSESDWVIIKRPHGIFLKYLDGRTEIPCQNESVQQIIEDNFGIESILNIKVGDKACYAYA